MKIVMYDDYGQVTEECLDVHDCRGTGGCGEPAECEDCGHVAEQTRPVYVWSCADGVTFWACADCIVSDDFCDLSA